MILRRTIIPLGFLAWSLTLAGCTSSGDDGASDDRSTDDGAGQERLDGTAPPGGAADLEATESAIAGSERLGDYTLSDRDHGTEVRVTVEAGLRTIEANAIPNHETGDFPNDGNPNRITEQSVTYSFPASGTLLGRTRPAATPGVGLNGVSFEPGTAEAVTCTSGETYRIEALQDRYDLGLDQNDAHVQPNGAYHYHGPPAGLVDAFDTDDDLVHVGFAADGFLMYVSTSSALRPSYRLADGTRTGTGCTYRGQAVDIDGTTPDGTYLSDWVFDTDRGDLDECNGITVDGEYLYVLTEEYPFIPRCLSGDFTDPGPGGAPPDQGAGSGDGDGAGGSSSGGDQDDGP